MKNLYHISVYELGNKITLKPRVPSNRIEHGGRLITHPYSGEVSDKEDDNFPRICTSFKISGCIDAIKDVYGCCECWVYKAIRPKYVSRDLPLMLVNDAKETGETWILRACRFEKIGLISYDDYGWKWIKKLKKDKNNS